MFIFISKITLLCLAAALLPKRAPPTAMINFCLRERGISSLSNTCIHSTKRISGGASLNGGKACEGGEKGEKEGRAGDSAQSLQKHSKCRVGMPTECLAPGTRNTTLFRELVRGIRLTIHNRPQISTPFTLFVVLFFFWSHSFRMEKLTVAFSVVLSMFLMKSETKSVSKGVLPFGYIWRSHVVT